MALWPCLLFLLSALAAAGSPDLAGEWSLSKYTNQTGVNYYGLLKLEQLSDSRGVKTYTGTLDWTIGIHSTIEGHMTKDQFVLERTDVAPHGCHTRAPRARRGVGSTARQPLSSPCCSSW